MKETGGHWDPLTLSPQLLAVASAKADLCALSVHITLYVPKSTDNTQHMWVLRASPLVRAFLEGTDDYLALTVQVFVFASLNRLIC